jgi:hypothetical protein
LYFLVGITSSGLDLKNTFLGCQKGDIESSISKIENKNVALAGVVHPLRDEIEVNGGRGSFLLLL